MRFKRGQEGSWDNSLFVMWINHVIDIILPVYILLPDRWTA